MKSLIATSALFFFAVSIAYGQASGSAGQSNPDSAKPAQTPASNPVETTGKPKKKKVWTNDEISTVGGPGSISVVGKANDPQAEESNSSGNAGARGAASAKQRQVAGYRPAAPAEQPIGSHGQTNFRSAQFQSKQYQRFRRNQHESPVLDDSRGRAG